MAQEKQQSNLEPHGGHAKVVAYLDDAWFKGGGGTAYTGWENVGRRMR